MLQNTGYFEVKDKILYHTTNSKMFNVGDVLDVGKIKNNMYKRVFEKEYLINGESVYDSEHYVKKVKKYKLVSGKTINEFKNVIDDYDFSLRELAIEQVRTNGFKKYPSRFLSLYVCDNLNDALLWYPLISYKRENAQLLKLKCTGKLFIGDSRQNTKNNNSFNYYLEQAQKYWSGEITDNPRFECLFEGKAEVVEILKEIK